MCIREKLYYKHISFIKEMQRKMDVYFELNQSCLNSSLVLFRGTKNIPLVCDHDKKTNKLNSPVTLLC